MPVTLPSFGLCFRLRFVDADVGMSTWPVQLYEVAARPFEK